MYNKLQKLRKLLLIDYYSIWFFCFMSQPLGKLIFTLIVFRSSSYRRYHDLHPELDTRSPASYLYPVYLVVSCRSEITYLHALQSRVWWLVTLNDRKHEFGSRLEFNNADGIIFGCHYTNSRLIGWRLKAGTSSWTINDC